MVLQVVPATELDAPRAVAIENEAYGPSPLSQTIFPGPFPPTPQGVNPRAARLIEIKRAEPASRWVKVIDTELPEGQDSNNMVAFASWFFWEKPYVAPPDVWGPGTNPEACECFFGDMRERRNARFAGRPYAYLKLLHTDPAHQRRGAGTMLINWGLEEAKRRGLDSYLESSPRGKHLYTKCGFKVVEEVNTDLTPWGGPSENITTLMLNEAKQ